MTYVIAEIGSNHDGDYWQAVQLIGAAREAGADAVKFQCLPNLPHDWLPQFVHGYTLLDVFATPFDVDAVRELAALRVPYLKIASVEMVRDDLIEAAARTRLPLLVSTGMATNSEIKHMLDLVGSFWTKVTLLQCTTRYPTPLDQVNLRAMVEMREIFDVPVGLSDHSTSTVIPAAAVALGATVIEKHFTLDRSLPGPDHPFALEPPEFAEMVKNIREVEKAMGDDWKLGPQEGEMFELRGRRLQW